MSEVLWSFFLGFIGGAVAASVIWAIELGRHE